MQKLKKPGRVVVGLTGSFGSGKSTAAGFFREMGTQVIDADRLAHEALLKDSPVYDEIRRMLGPEIEEDENGIVRAKLAEKIFRDSGIRKKLETIVHPYVFSRIAEEIEKYQPSITVVEVPLLFESGFNEFCDHTVVVNADQKVIDERLAKKGFNKKEIEARRAAQMPAGEKIKKAGFVIDNSGALENTKMEVKKVLVQIEKISKGAL